MWDLDLKGVYELNYLHSGKKIEKSTFHFLLLPVSYQ